MIEFDLNLILASAITFLIALAILWRLAYKPLLGMMRERAEKIASDLDAAEASRKETEALGKKLESEMAGIRAKADEAMNIAIQAGETSRQAMLDEARAQGALVLKRAQEMIAIEKDKAFSALRNEVVDISYRMAEQILGQAIDRSASEQLVEQAAREMKVKS